MEEYIKCDNGQYVNLYTVKVAMKERLQRNPNRYSTAYELACAVDALLDLSSGEPDSTLISLAQAVIAEQRAGQATELVPATGALQGRPYTALADRGERPGRTRRSQW